MPASYDSDRLFEFAPELTLGLRAGAFEGYGNVTGLDDMRKRAALETWMTNVRHEASGDWIIKKGRDFSYLDWFALDLEDIGVQASKTKQHWDALRLAVNGNNDPKNPYDEASVKDNLEKFNQYWNSEHKQIEVALSRKPFREGTQTWSVVHANQQPGLCKLFESGILVGKQSMYAGHEYTNQQGRGAKLPNRTGGYWAHDYPTGKTTRGAARVVIGPEKSETDKSREVWYTDTHYASFVRVIGGHPLVRKTT